MLCVSVVLIILGLASGDKPEPPSMPTNVLFAMSMNSIRKISSVDASYDLDFYCNFVWRDDRLHTKLVQGLGFDPAADFQPAPEFLNAADDTGIELSYQLLSEANIPAWAGLTASGDVNATYVTGYGRKSGTFIADVNLREFPFDQQNVTIRMESADYLSSELVWQPVGVLRGLNPTDVQPSGWDDIANAYMVTSVTYATLGETYSRFTGLKILGRQYSYYLNRVIANIILLVLMGALSVFLNPLEADRLGYVQGAFLGVVSWLFVLSAEVPQVGYANRLDGFVNVSFACLFMQYVWHCAAWGFGKCLRRGHLFAKPKAFRTGNEDDWSDSEDDGTTPIKSADPKEIAASVPSPAAVHPPAPMPSRGGGSSSVAPIVTSDEKPGASAAAAACDATPGSSGGADRPLRMKKKHWKRRTCGTCPCSYYGEWHLLAPHRRADVIVTSVILAIYAIATGVIIGGGVTLANTKPPLPGTGVYN